ncbi:MAG: hypothetical protein IPG17_33060 [Sandaracinaceae bacterium]|nr:hypothetical protein [Sandaracinaceae bacterium]
MSRQRYDIAELLPDGLSSFRRVGYLLGEAECLSQQPGRLHRYQGRLNLAEMTYRRAISLYSRLSSSKVLVPAAQPGSVLLGRDR